MNIINLARLGQQANLDDQIRLCLLSAPMEEIDQSSISRGDA